MLIQEILEIYCHNISILTLNIENGSNGRFTCRFNIYTIDSKNYLKVIYKNIHIIYIFNSSK
jgi:hypothetical protein